MSTISPSGALFAAFLGYNPVQDDPYRALSAGAGRYRSGNPCNTHREIWFPTTLAQAFMPSLALSFYIGAGISFVAALLCLMRGEKYVQEVDGADKDGKIETEPQQVSGEQIK